MKFSDRSLERLVIHCTATERGRDVTSDEIRHWHTDPKPKGRGWSKIGYSDMIHLDGTIENLTPYNSDDIVDDWEITYGASGFNATSRHVVYVGGLLNGKSWDTRTPQQSLTLKFYAKLFLLNHPGRDIVGHNKLNNKKDCPCFDVEAWRANNQIF